MNIPVVMYGIAGYAFPFWEKKNIEIRPISAPVIMKSAGTMSYARINTPAVIIGNMTSPPPRIARLTLYFLFFTEVGIFLFLYFCFTFSICALTFLEADGIKNPPNIFNSCIWKAAIFCMIPDFQTAHAS